jgi:flagellar protein FlaG
MMSIDGVSNKTADPVLQAIATADRSVNIPASKPAAPVEPIQSSFKVNEKVTISSSDIQQAIEQLNMRMQNMNRNVNFSVDQASGRDVVRVTNQNTGELVRQLPFEDTLQFMRNLDHMIGLIFDKKT